MTTMTMMMLTMMMTKMTKMVIVITQAGLQNHEAAGLCKDVDGANQEVLM